MEIKDIYYIRDHLIILDQKDNIFYIAANNLQSGDALNLSNIERNYGNVLKLKNSEWNITLVDDAFRVNTINSRFITLMRRILRKE
jgi:hypothetical protein